MAKKKTAKKKTSKKKVAKKASATKGPSKPRKPSAGKTSVNKSQLIREYAAANPTAGPTAIAKALTATGVSITPSFVSVVRGKANGGKPKRGRGRPKKSSVSANSGGGISIEELKAAKQFAAKVGGVERAQSALNALATILD